MDPMRIDEGKAKNFTKFPWVQIGIIALIGLLAGVGGIGYLETRGPDLSAAPEPFVVPMDMSGYAAIQKLKEKGFIRNPWVFEAILRSKNPLGRVMPGGYEIAKSMSAFRLAEVISGNPHSLWVTVPEGLRKEEIAELMTAKLGWKPEDSEAFLNIYRGLGVEYYEGVYFPETYLVPVQDEGDKVAKRMIQLFNEKLATLTPALAKENIKWTTALTMASMIEREAANKADMAIISAILWNRLEKGMRLEVDATVQYARGKTDAGWWAPIRSEDKSIESPYNTYRIKGLPTGPISNPGLEALKAAVFPANSKCLFYIHDKERKMYCANTFDEHRRNIEKYL